MVGDRYDKMLHFFGGKGGVIWNYDKEGNPVSITSRTAMKKKYSKICRIAAAEERKKRRVEHEVRKMVYRNKKLQDKHHDPKHLKQDDGQNE